MNRVGRRSACLLLALWGFGSSLGVQAADPPSGVLRWRMATSWSTATPVLGELSGRLVEELRVASQGRLDVRVEDPGYHKSPAGVFGMVRSGTYEIGLTASHFSRGRETPAAAFASLAFGLTETERQAWYFGGGGLQRLQDALGYLGIWAYPVGNPLLESGLWTKRELKSVEDLRSLRLRMPGDAFGAIKRLGLRGPSLPLAELGDALTQGRVDAAHWIGAAAKDLMTGPRVRYFYPAWQDPVAEVLLLVNADKLANLPPDLRWILLAAIKSLAADLQAAGFKQQEERLEQLAKSKIEIKPLPRDLQSALREANDEALREFAARSAEFDEAYQERQAFLARWRDRARQGLAPH